MSWCYNCGDDFRYDDIGGYNPPCPCGLRCRDCCGASSKRYCPEGTEDDDFDYEEDDPIAQMQYDQWLEENAMPPMMPIEGTPFGEREVKDG